MFPVCKKCQRPVRGHVGPTGSSCSQPSPQFLTHVPLSSSLLPADLANIQEELEASIKSHEDQIQHLFAEVGDLRLNSTSRFSPHTCLHSAWSSCQRCSDDAQHGRQGFCNLVATLAGCSFASGLAPGPAATAINFLCCFCCLRFPSSDRSSTAVAPTTAGTCGFCP